MTKEEAIEWNKNLKMYMKLSDRIQPCKFPKSNYLALDMSIEALEQTRWIPVSERLPEEHKEVLTCSSGGYIEIQSIEGAYSYWENQKGDWSDMDEIVAWMPLPPAIQSRGE